MLDNVRIRLARRLGPRYWPAWYLAPRWKLDQWHKIACDVEPELCPVCSRHYGLEYEG